MLILQRHIFRYAMPMPSFADAARKVAVSRWRFHYRRLLLPLLLLPAAAAIAMLMLMMPYALPFDMLISISRCYAAADATP